MTERDLFIRRVYTYQNIHVCVEIDYMSRTVSLVEKQPNDSFGRKKWLFADRELKYMDGWLQILEAMKYAVTEAKKLLEADDEEQINKLVEMAALLDSPPEPAKK